MSMLISLKFVLLKLDAGVEESEKSMVIVDKAAPIELFLLMES